MSRGTVNNKDTIFALTTGSLPSGVAILKLSGSKAFEITERLFSPYSKEEKLVLGSFKNHLGEEVDKGLLLQFKNPNSHTGEDIAEYHLHGSKAIVTAMEYSIESFGGRKARPGEFSYRAFLNGKTTLQELENLGDIFSTAQEEGLKRIYSRRDGSLEKKVLELKENLIRVQAILDTAVDFADEYSNVASSSAKPLEMTIHRISEIIQRYSTLKSSNELPKLVIAGKPNAGKSSLFNALLCRYRAIVHSEPGTTRDVIEEEVLFNNRPWKLVDTAGIRETSSTSEKEGIEIGSHYLSGATFWLLVVDGETGLTKEDFELLEKFQSTPHAIVWNKKDLTKWVAPKEEWILTKTKYISAETGEGISELIQHISEQIAKANVAQDIPTPTRVQAVRLGVVLEDLKNIRSGLNRNEAPEYLAELNRLSMQHLDVVLGEVSIDEVLDRVFNEFCIGK